MGAGAGTDGPARPRITLRIRLTLWVVAIYTLMQWVTGGVLWLYQSASIDRMFDQQLLERADAMVQQVSSMVPGLDRETLRHIAEQQTRHIEGESYAVDLFRKDGLPAARGGWPVFDRRDLPFDDLLASGRPMFLRLNARVGGAEEAAASGDAGDSDPPERWDNARAVAMVVLGADLEPYVLVVASSDTFASRQQVLARRTFLASSIGATLVAAASGWFIAGIAVSPLERLRRLASELGPESLDRELDMPVSNIEVADLRDQLEEARRRIRDAFAAQERFMTNVSHELKTPIAVILTEAQTLNLDDAPDEIAHFVSSTREEMQRLGRLVESFLMLARLRDGPGRVRGKRCHVNDLVMDAVERSSKMAEQRGVRLTAELLDGESELDAAVAGDPELLLTMLDNMIRNAIRFTPPGLRVAVSWSLGLDFVRITVSDEGPAMSPDHVWSAANRFSRSENPPGSRGHGLGLAIAQGVAELHGGRIHSENLDGGGCAFTVRLPLAVPEPAI